VLNGTAVARSKFGLIQRFGVIVGWALLGAFAWECATHSVDFPVYHGIAARILHGDYELYPLALYDGGPVPSHGFRYAPFVAFLFVPFGWLPLEAAALLFFALKAIAFVYVTGLVLRYVGHPVEDRVLMLAALLLVAGYAAEEFRYGNFHFFVVALMAVAFVAAERGRVAVPAFSLALAIAAKLTPLLLLAYFALRRRFAICGATIAALAAIWVLPSAVVGEQMNSRLGRGFIRYAVQKIGEEDNYALRGVLYRYLTPDHGTNPDRPNTSVAALSPATITAIWLALIAAGGLVLAIVLWKEAATPSVRLLEFSLVLTAMLLASPHTQRRYFVSLYVPMLALLAVLRQQPRMVRGPVLTTGLVATAAASTVLPLAFGGRRLALVYEATSPYFWATLILMGALVWVTVQLKALETTKNESAAKSRKS
jgi:hypothetical protein